MATFQVQVDKLSLRKLFNQSIVFQCSTTKVLLNVKISSPK